MLSDDPFLFVFQEDNKIDIVVKAMVVLAVIVEIETFGKEFHVFLVADKANML